MVGKKSKQLDEIVNIASANLAQAVVRLFYIGTAFEKHTLKLTRSSLVEDFVCSMFADAFDTIFFLFRLGIICVYFKTVAREKCSANGQRFQYFSFRFSIRSLILVKIRRKTDDFIYGIARERLIEIYDA